MVPAIDVGCWGLAALADADADSCLVRPALAHLALRWSALLGQHSAEDIGESLLADGLGLCEFEHIED